MDFFGQDLQDFLDQDTTYLFKNSKSEPPRHKGRKGFQKNDRLKARVAGTPMPTYWGGWKYTMKRISELIFFH